MPRLRFTPDQAAAEAKRLATEFVATLPRSAGSRCTSVAPDNSASKSGNTKIAVEWTVMFVFHPPESIVDGGELILTVNIETGHVRMWE